jgi:hypothetical protein
MCNIFTFQSNKNLLTRVGFERTTFCARSQVTHELHLIIDGVSFAYT